MQIITIDRHLKNNVFFFGYYFRSFYRDKFKDKTHWYAKKERILTCLTKQLFLLRFRYL